MLENSSKVAIIALERISLEDELCFDYTTGNANVSTLSSRFMRQDTLKTQLGFECSCSRCNADTVTEDIDVD